ncbi:MAG: tetraacyldisaccharide 4'-kinase [Burkholderiales bacterium]
MSFEERVVAAWYEPRPTAAAWLAWPLSLLFGIVSGCRRALHARGFLPVERLPVPVIVVGNITAGGSGKTPLVIALAEALRDRGFHPGIVSRGHGGHGRVEAVAPDSDPAVAGDEPPIIAAAGFPVWVGRKRAHAGRALLAAHPGCDVVICDDGLQHYALARDVEICVIDAARGLGNGLLMPAGPLRERASRLEEVDAVVRLVSGIVRENPTGDARSTFMTHEPLPWRNVRDPARTDDGTRFRGEGIHAIAGIGHPQRFFAMLRGLGIAAAEHPFPDHHPFGPGDLDFPGAKAILMTAKDAVKCASFADERCWYLPIRALVDPSLVAFVEDKIRGSQAA